jgi:hypothetical protein
VYVVDRDQAADLTPKSLVEKKAIPGIRFSLIVVNYHLGRETVRPCMSQLPVGGFIDSISDQRKLCHIE